MEFGCQISPSAARPEYLIRDGCTVGLSVRVSGSYIMHSGWAALALYEKHVDYQCKQASASMPGAECRQNTLWFSNRQVQDLTMVHRDVRLVLPTPDWQPPMTDDSPIHAAAALCHASLCAKQRRSHMQAGR